MKVLKKVLIAILIIISIPLIIALFTPKSYQLEREIVIEKSKTEVFDYLKYLKNQDNFSKWANMDPYMKKSYKGVDGTVGFISAWESDSSDVGRGEQEIVSIEPETRIDYKLRFFEPFASADDAYIITESLSENSTKVTWGFSGSMDYPLNLMLLVIDFEEMLGNDFEEGLQKMKQNLEN